MKSPQKKIEDKLWQECRRIQHNRYKKDNGLVDCFTCGAKDLEGSNAQLGHCYPKGACGATMKYDLRHLRWQDARCNVFFGGMGAVFKTNLEKELGKKEAQQIEKDYWRSKSMPVKAIDHYTKLLDEYKKL